MLVYPQTAETGPDSLTKELIADNYQLKLIPREVLLSQASNHGEEEAAETSLNATDKNIKLQIESAKIANRHIPPYRLMVATAYTLARYTYEGLYRKTGSEYINHPERIAAMDWYIEMQLRTEFSEEYNLNSAKFDAMLDAAIVFDLHHDGVEVNSPINKPARARRGRIVSPLCARTLMEDHDNPYAEDTAKGLVDVTHFKGMEWMLNWEEYVREQVMTSKFAARRKPGDIFDNRRNELKPVNIAVEEAERNERHERYDRLSPEIQAAAVDLADPEDRERVRRGGELLLAIEPGLQPYKVARFRMYKNGST